MKHYQQVRQSIRDKSVNAFGKEPGSLDELAEFVMHTINRKEKVLGFAWDIKEGAVSNSHSCPINGTTNWSGQEPGAPRSYCGFGGRVWIRFQNTHRECSSAFNETFTHTGTGGGGSYDGPWMRVAHEHFRAYGTNLTIPGTYQRPCIFSWDYRIYLDDWPALKESIEQEEVIARLAKVPRKISHTFEWNDSATKAADEAFVKRVTQGIVAKL